MRPAETGSAMIEALVAIAIVAGVLAATFAASGRVAIGTRVAEDKRLALMVAQSRLAAVGIESPLEPGQTDGVDGAYIWSATVTPAPAPASATGTLMEVTIAVAARDRPDRPLATLDSLRLLPAPPA